MEWSIIVGWIMPFLIFLIFIFLIGIRIVRPTEKGLIERLGKYKKTAEQGFHWIIPGIDKIIKETFTYVEEYRKHGGERWWKNITIPPTPR